MFGRNDGNIIICDFGDDIVKVFFFGGIELLWFFGVLYCDDYEFLLFVVFD